MRNSWIFVPTGFGLWWFAAGLSAVMPLSGGIWALLITAASAIAACGLRRHGTTGRFDRRIFRYSVLGEIVGISVVLLACLLLARPDMIMPMIGAVVGLHFLPLAKAFGDGRFVVAGCLVTSISFASLFWSPPMRMAITGIGAGATLWAFALWASLRRAV